jgi:hypothetical protein
MLGKYIDYEILYKLNDIDLGSMCKVNKYYRQICDDMFWMNRSLKRFSFVLGNIETMKKYKTEKTWKLYYIRLVDYLEKKYTNKPFYERPLRNDIKNIEQLFGINYVNNYIKHLHNFDLDILKKDLENDFLNPNEYEEIFDILNTEQIEKFIPLLIKSPHFRFNNFPYYDHPKFLKIIYDVKKNNKKFILTVLYTVFKIYPTKQILVEILFKISGEEIIKELFNYISSGNTTTYNNLILFWI